MKVALVLTGLSRVWEEAYPTLKQYFIDGYDTDVFINIWSERGYYSGKGYIQSPTDAFVKTTPDDKGFHTSGLLTDVNKIMEAYKPRIMRVEDFSPVEHFFDEYSKMFVNAYTRPKNTAAQAYMAWRGIQLMEEAGTHYDVVIRARPDIVLRGNPMPVPMDTMTTLAMGNKNGQGTGDGIFISNHEQAVKFADMWKNLAYLYQKCGVSCPHLFAAEWITTNKMPWVQSHVGAYMTHSPKGPYQEPD